MATGSVNKVFVFSAAIRGFHVYRDTWIPSEQEKLCCVFEENNVFDMFAIKTLHADGRTTVGHLPREISRPTKFLLDRGAKVEAELSATHYRRSPLFQGGLEIPCVVRVTMPGSIIGHLLLEEYEKMVIRVYCEPKEEIIMGKFIESVNVGIVEQNQLNQNQPIRKKRKTERNPPVPKSKDIRSFFNKTNDITSKKKKSNPDL